MMLPSSAESLRAARGTLIPLDEVQLRKASVSACLAARLVRAAQVGGVELLDPSRSLLLCLKLAPIQLPSTPPPLRFPAQHHPLHLLDLWAQFAEALGAEAALQRQPLPGFITAPTARSHILRQTRVARRSFRWDFPLPLFSLLPFTSLLSRDSSAGAALLCHRVQESQGSGWLSTPGLAPIQAVESR